MHPTATISRYITGMMTPLVFVVLLCVGTCQFNTLRPTQNGRHFADDTFKLLFVNENIRFSIKMSLKFVPKVPIYNIPMMVRLSTHICVSPPQRVNPYPSELLQWFNEAIPWIYIYIYIIRHGNKSDGYKPHWWTQFRQKRNKLYILWDILYAIIT